MSKDLISNLKQCQNGEIDKAIVMYNNLNFENEFIKLVRIDSSNKWEGTPHHSEMCKQWSIIIELKKRFTDLEGYKYLQKFFRIKVTPVVKGENKGCYGIRIYDMKKNPSILLVKDLLNAIFS